VFFGFIALISAVSCMALYFTSFKFYEKALPTAEVKGLGRIQPRTVWKEGYGWWVFALVLVAIVELLTIVWALMRHYDGHIPGFIGGASLLLACALGIYGVGLGQRSHNIRVRRESAKAALGDLN